MRNISILLLSGALLLSTCTRVDVEETTARVPEQVTTTTTVIQPVPATTSTTIQEVEVDLPTEESTTTTTVFVDFADPVRMFSDALGVEDVVVTTKSKKESKNYPLEGQVQWIPVGDRDVGPCENGLVMTASHLNKGEPYYNVVDDSTNDRHGKNDRGLVVGDIVSFELGDGTVCNYSVIEPLGVNLPNAKVVEGQPAIYFLKDSEIMNPILGALITIVGDRPIVSMWVSYGGPNGGEWRTLAKRNRKYNAVVFAKLIEFQGS